MTRSSLALIAALALAPAALARQSAPDLTADAVLASVRAAVRYDAVRARPNGFAGAGRARFNGVETAFQMAFAPDGRFYTRVDGPLGGIAGFDGRTGWAVDWSGMPRRLELEELDEEQLEVWFLTGHWLAEPGPYEISLDPKQTSSSRVALTLRRAGAPLRATVFVDRATWLPESVVRRSDHGERIVTLADYREEAGALVPFRATRSTGKVVDRFELRAFGPAPAGANPYAPVASRPADTTWKAGAAAGLEARRARSGHVLVRPLVNGRDVGWFILDSGAGAMVIGPRAASRAGLDALGEVHVHGVGGSEKARFRMGGRFELGPLGIEGLRFVELDLDFLSSAFGVTVGGIVGYDLFARAIVELDVEAPAVRLFDPTTYQLRAGQWDEVLLSHKHPAVRARFEGGHEGIFRLDTGAGGTVTLHAPVVERLGLLEGRTTTGGRAGGIGGVSENRRGPLEWFELGGVRFERPMVEFSKAERGAFADDYLMGNVGTGLLEAFTVVFDHAHKRIAFVPLAGRKEATSPRRR